MKRFPLKSRGSREKAKERFARQFHSTEFVEWMKGKPCCCGGCRGMTFNLTIGWHAGGSIEVSHVISRGAGGTWRDTVPMSRTCHSEFHQKGRLSFCQARGWPLERLSELAAGYAREWEAICQP